MAEPKVITTEAFESGLILCEAYFHEVAQPIIERLLRPTEYAAGLIGWGSDVLGYDDVHSTDHMWGPRFHLFLDPDVFGAKGEALDQLLRRSLPPRFRGFSTHFGSSPKGDCLAMHDGPSDEVNHLIEIHTVKGFLTEYIGTDDPSALRPEEWTQIEEHRLLGLASGAVFHDGLGSLGRIRQEFKFYPKDVWCRLMARRWQQIADEEAFVGRCGASGDDLGSRLVTARIVQAGMHLAFHQERRYAPYSKWFGRAFQELRCAPLLGRAFQQALSVTNWVERDAALCDGYRCLAAQHNSLQLAEPLSIQIGPAYDGRPGNCIHAGRFARQLIGLTGTAQRDG